MEKPRAMLTAADPIRKCFVELKRSLRIADEFRMDLTSIDAVSAATLSDVREIASTTMRKMQMFNVIVADGVPTTTDVVVGLCAELNRALAEILYRDAVDPDAASAVKEALMAIQSCGIAVGTMMEPGEVLDLE